MLTKIKEMLLKQGCPSVSEDDSLDGGSVTVIGKCAYRGANGTKCALGMYITDEEYDPVMEDLTANTLEMKYPDLTLWDMMPIELWSKCQSAHDTDFMKEDLYWREEWSKEMDYLIQEYPEYA